MSLKKMYVVMKKRGILHREVFHAYKTDRDTIYFDNITITNAGANFRCHVSPELEAYFFPVASEARNFLLAATQNGDNWDWTAFAQACSEDTKLSRSVP